MGKSQRTKGASYEREVAAVFSAALGQEFKRNITQARDGGHDLIVGPLVVECKRRKTLTTIGKWYEQAKAAARGRWSRRKPEVSGAAQEPPIPGMPIIVCREDNGESLVVLRLSDFLILTRDELAAHLS